MPLFLILGEATILGFKTLEENVVATNNLITTISCISRHENFSLLCKQTELLQAIYNVVSSDSFERRFCTYIHVRITFMKKESVSSQSI